MDARVTAVTLAARDLPALVGFYSRLGFPLKTLVEGDVAFFDLGGAVLILWTGLSGTPNGAVQLAHNVRTREEVDAVLSEAVEAGATLVTAAADQEWGGRSGTFADPEGHEWEVAWNPGWTLRPDGSVGL